MVCFLALVLEMALRRRLAELGKEVRYQDLLLNFSRLKAVEIDLDGIRYLARTQLVGQVALAFKAMKMRPLFTCYPDATSFLADA